MKKLSIIILLFFGAINANGQGCLITPYAVQDTLDCGDTLFVNFNAFASAALQETFTATGPSDPGWATTSGAQYDNPYIPSPTNDTYFWMGPSAVVPTSLTTVPFNVAGGGQVCFDFVYAGQGGSSPIEQPDEYDEGITLQYNNGSGWVDMVYYPPVGGTLPSNPQTNTPNTSSLPGSVGPYEVWTTVCIPIPPGAQGPNTSFQWIQENNSGACCDHWGLDNIEILVADTNFEIVSLNDGVNLGPAPATYSTFVTSDTTFDFMYSNFFSDTCYGSVSTIMNPTDIGPDLVLDCNQNVVQLQATGVSPNDNFSWTPITGLSNPNVLNPTASPLDTTEYIFNSTCDADTMTLNVVSNYSFSTSDDTSICVGDPAYLEVFGGAENFAWTPNNGTINDTTLRAPTFTPTVTTTYYVATDSAGCIKMDTMTVYVSNKVWALILPPTDADCNGNNNGSLFSVASGGINTPYDFELSLNGSVITNQNTGIFSNLGSGDYTITVNDSMGACPIDTTLTVGGGLNVNIDSTYFENPFCVGDTSGRIEIFIDTNVVVNYSLNGGASQTSNIFSGLTDGVYNISVQYGTCPPALDTITLSAAATIDIQFVDSTNLSCFGSADGEIYVTASMGVQPYQFSLDNIIFQSDSFFTSLNAGTYAIYAMDNNGCRDSLVTSISEPAIMLLNNVNVTDIQCNGDSSGSISFNVINGTSPYQYSIDSGLTYQTSNNFNNLPQEAYVLLATDTNGCYSNIIHDTITEPTQLNLVLDSTISSTCGTADGSLSVIASGGAGTYTFSIDTGLNSQATSTFNNLTAGIYNILVTDANGCSESLDVSIANFGAPTLTITSFDSVLCNGESTATVQLSAMGGTLPYQFSVDAGANQTDSLFTNLSGGLHNFTVIDGNTCQGTVSITIYEPPLLTLTTTTDSTSCSGNNDGEITISALGGTLPYIYAIDDTSMVQLTNNFTGFAPAVYTAYVLDANACLTSVSSEVYQGDNVQIDAVAVVDATCNNSSDAQITISASGGGSIYTYAVNDTSTVQSSNVFNGLSAGIDTAYVFDENGCFAFTPFTVQEPDTLIINNINPLDISCNDDGSFTVNAQGGTMAYTYTLDGGSSQTSNVFTITTAGTYTLGVTDLNNCDTAKMVGTIIAPNAVTFTIDTATISLACNNLNNGLIGINAAGGSAPYDYSIDNGNSFQTDSFFANLSAGTYTVIIQDVFGCLADSTVNVTIAQPAALNGNSSSTGISCNGDTDGVVTINNISGGTAPYMVEVDGVSSPYAPGLNFANLAAGTYAVNVTDNNNCTFTWNETVADVAAIALNATTPTNVSCFGAADGEISISATGGTPNYDFTITLGAYTETVNSNSSAVFSNLEGTEIGLTYTISILDLNGCSANLTQTITQPNQLIIEGIDTSALSCFGASDATMTVNASGGSFPYSYLWTPSDQTGSTASGLNPGVYSVAVTDDNNCTISASQTILDVAPVLATIVPDSALVSMGDDIQLGIDVENALGTVLQYSWSPTEGLSCSDCEDPVVTTYNDIAYSVVVTDENGCSSYNFTEVYITVDGSLFYFIPNAFSPNGDGVNDIFNILGQDVQNVDLQLFNRWGEKVFEGSNQFITWDGTYKGELQGPGVYSYITVITFLNDVEVVKKGTVTLLR